MAIYIAICDDKTADRKQTERLLGRESDTRLHTTGVLYIDSFGSKEALLATPMRYDLFLIDRSESGEDSLQIGTSLRSLGVIVPIVLCTSDSVKMQQYESQTDFGTLRKPILKQELSSLIDHCIEEKKHRSPLIELRGEYETYYVTAEELLYAKEDDGFVNVTLTGSRHAHIRGDIYDIQVLIHGSGNFLQINKDTVINLAYVAEVKGRSFLMTDHEWMTFSFFDQRKMLRAYEEYKQNTK